MARLTISAEQEAFDGDARLFRLGVEAHRLGLAYEYDPFSLSIARVDPLPHQLEAVYDYFLRLPRIRFLLADDPGAGKTIMAGLLLKELKARGLIRRTLIVTPANLTFQWQRELADKFREKFDIIRGNVLRANYGQNPWQERDRVISSVSRVSFIEDARESLLRPGCRRIEPGQSHRRRAIPPPHILSPRPIDYHDWHAGLIIVRPANPLDAPEAAIIDDIGQNFEVVWSAPTRHRYMNAVIMDDCEQYYLARVVE